MTAQEWFGFACPEFILRIVRAAGRETERTSRLFACACARGVWSLVSDAGYRRVLEAAERFADGVTDVDGLAAALRAVGRRGALRGPEGFAQQACWDAAYSGPALARVTGFACAAWPYDLAIYAALHSRTAAEEAARAGRRAAGDAVRRASEAQARYQADCLGDIFGAPSRPCFNSAWRTPTVAAVARAAYEERSLPEGTLDPDRLAVLADALEDAGCTEGNLLTHLRYSGAHVRGCWVLDAVLEKGHAPA